MKHKKPATIWFDEQSGVLKIRCDFDSKFIESLKVHIPIKSRAWNKQTKTWEVEVAFLDTALHLMTKFFDHIVTPQFGKRNSALQNKPDESDPYSTLLRLAPDDLVKKVYRELAKELHPDKGGDKDKIQKVIKAYERIKKERKL